MSVNNLKSGVPIFPLIKREFQYINSLIRIEREQKFYLIHLKTFFPEKSSIEDIEACYKKFICEAYKIIYLYSPRTIELDDDQTLEELKAMNLIREI
jgi:hypothetical protein